MQMAVRKDDLRGQEIAQLLQAHLDYAAQHSPRESRHALDIDSLRAPDITFWTAWEGPVLLGCGALKEIDLRHGEIKSMHTAEPYRGQGVGTRLLAHMIDESLRRGYHRLSLETGSMEAFAAARGLYCRLGFAYCEPFAGYRSDPNSVFMTLDLTAPRVRGRDPLEPLADQHASACVHRA
jgi:putative acetyltransferase